MRDRTYLAASRQLDALGVDSFEVGVRDRAGRMLIRSWSKAEVLKAIPWLKSQNAQGADVYVRPASPGGNANAGIVLVDDLSRETVARMKADGLTPALLVETSPGSYQVWVRVHENRIEQRTATELAKTVATQYGGNPNSADWRQFGRLAGFTNNKREHKDASGQSPFVLAHESTGKAAPAGLELVHQAAERVMDKAKAEASRAAMPPGAAKTGAGAPKLGDPVQVYQNTLKALHGRFGADMDLSRADFMAGLYMADAGFTIDQVKTALATSPAVSIRKAGHGGDYVERTAQAIAKHQAQRPQIPQQPPTQVHGPRLRM